MLDATNDILIASDIATKLFNNNG